LIRIILAIILCISLSLPAISKTTIKSEPPWIITNDEGGSIEAYLKKFRYIYYKSNRRVIIKGVCASSCTLALKLKNMCVMPNARLGFHKAWSPTPYGPIINPYGSAYLEHVIPPELKSRLFPLTLRMKWVKGKDLPKRFWCR
jgi:hypothetical protein